MSAYGYTRAQILPYRSLTAAEEGVLNKGTLFPLPSLLLWSSLPNQSHRNLIWGEILFDLLFASVFVTLGFFFQSNVFALSHASADGFECLFMDLALIVAVLCISVWHPAAVYQNRLGSASVSHVLVSFALLVPTLLFAVNLVRLDAASLRASSLLAPGHGDQRSLITIALAQTIFLTRVVLLLVFIAVKRGYKREERLRRISQLHASGFHSISDEHSHEAEQDAEAIATGSVSGASAVPGSVRPSSSLSPLNMISYANAQLVEHALFALPSLMILLSAPLFSDFPRLLFGLTLIAEPISNFCYAFIFTERYSARLNHHRLQIRHGCLFFFALLLLLSPLVLSRDVASTADRALSTQGTSVHGKGVAFANPSLAPGVPTNSFSNFASSFGVGSSRKSKSDSSSSSPIRSTSGDSSSTSKTTPKSSEVSLATRLIAPSGSILPTFENSASTSSSATSSAPKSAPASKNPPSFMDKMKTKLHEVDEELRDTFAGWSALFHSLIALLLVCALVGGIGALYLASDSDPAELHAMKRNFFTRVLWTFAHPILILALIVLAASLLQIAKLENGSNINIAPDLRSVSGLTGGQSAGGLVSENPALFSKTAAAFDIATNFLGPSAASMARSAVAQAFADDFRAASHGLAAGSLGLLILVLYGIRCLHSRTSLKEFARSLAEDEVLKRLGSAGWTFDDFRPPQEIRAQHERAQKLVLPPSRWLMTYLIDALYLGGGIALMILARSALVNSSLRDWPMSDFTLLLASIVVGLLFASLLHSVYVAHVLRGLLEVNASLAAGPASLERRYGRLDSPVALFGFDGAGCDCFEDEEYENGDEATEGAVYNAVDGSRDYLSHSDTYGSATERVALTTNARQRGYHGRKLRPSLLRRFIRSIFCCYGCCGLVSRYPSPSQHEAVSHVTPWYESLWRSWLCCGACRPVRWCGRYVVPCRCWGRNEDGSCYIVGCRALAEEDAARWLEEDSAAAQAIEDELVQQQRLEAEAEARARLGLTPADVSSSASAGRGGRYPSYPYERVGSDGLGSLYGALGDAYGRREDTPPYLSQNGKQRY